MDEKVKMSTLPPRYLSPDFGIGTWRAPILSTEARRALECNGYEPAASAPSSSCGGEVQRLCRGLSCRHRHAPETPPRPSLPSLPLPQPPSLSGSHVSLSSVFAKDASGTRPPLCREGGRGRNVRKGMPLFFCLAPQRTLRESKEKEGEWKHTTSSSCRSALYKIKLEVEEEEQQQQQEQQQEQQQ
ncbi:Protein of unknown function [Gryllus bimaculatus]|nr:Protein of unknown function [Gryllus bimaculatus]